MKTSNVLPALTVSLALVATSGFAQSAQDQQSSTSRSSMDSSSQMSASSSLSQSGNATSQMHRISKDSLDEKITAKDLLGQTVYDRNGESIGDITDISIRRALPQQTASAVQSQSDSSWGQSDNQSSQTAQSARTGQQDSQSGSLSASSSGMSRGGQSDDATIFLSVGGLFGIGDDIVAVPASQLRYDQEEEQFMINADRDEVVALAEQDATDYQDDSSTYSSWGASSDQDYSARQQFDDDADQSRSSDRNSGSTNSSTQSDTDSSW